jgi:FkbM family methyltransferase
MCFFTTAEQAMNPMNPLRRLAALLPDNLQLELKRLKYAWQLRGGRFVSDEPEFAVLDRYVRPGDWVVDVGANIGHYTKRLSDLVGHTGRVLAFEPMPATFSILAANAQRFTHPNVTLFNVALSDRSGLVGMTVPTYSDGLKNYYQAHVTCDDGLRVMVCALDLIGLQNRIALIKIDAEGHEEAVLAGMSRLIERDMPTLIVETGKQPVIDGLRRTGYEVEALPGSPNVLFTSTKRA